MRTRNLAAGKAVERKEVFARRKETRLMGEPEHSVS